MENDPGNSLRAARKRKGLPSAGIRDVARLAGVSTATVSRVFNSPETVSEAVRHTVKEAATTLAYIPHNAARALSSRRSRTLGIVIPTIQNSIFAEQVEHLQRRGAALGYSLFVALSGFSRQDELQQVRELVRNGIDGIMLVGANHLPEVYKLLKSRGIAYVNTSTGDPDSPHPNVGFDNAAAMARTARYLLSLGHRHICVISGDVEESDRARLRLDGARQAMQEAGVPLTDDRIFVTSYGMDASRSACRELMRRAPQTTAIMCHNDVQAFGALLELQRLDLPVPGAVSITGFDDLEWARHLSPALTTVRIPWGRMAEIAAEMLVSQLDGRDYQRSTVLESDLVVRDSTAPPRQGR